MDVIPVRPYVCPQPMLQHVNLGTRVSPLSGRSPDAAGMRGLVEQDRLKGHARWGPRIRLVPVQVGVSTLQCRDSFARWNSGSV